LPAKIIIEGRAQPAALIALIIVIYSQFPGCIALGQLLDSEPVTIFAVDIMSIEKPVSSKL